MLNQYMEAFLQCHWFLDTQPVDTAAVWQVLNRMAPEAMEFFHVEVYKSCLCDGGPESRVHHKFKQSHRRPMRSDVVIADTTWQYMSKYHHVQGVYGWFFQDAVDMNTRKRHCCASKERDGGEVEKCKLEQCGNLYRVRSPPSVSWILRTPGGLDLTLWHNMMNGVCLTWSHSSWAVWGAVFEEASGRITTAYLILKGGRARRGWIKLSTSSGKMTRWPGAKRENVREIMCQSPEINCHCGAYNNWSMESCPSCKLQCHRLCIRVQDHDQLSTPWDGEGCPHCASSNEND